MCHQCYQSDDSRHSHQQTNEPQILFQPWCHLYTRKTTVDREQCPAAHQTKQVPTEILLHWLQPFVAYWTEMNQSILKFFHLCNIHGVCISEVHDEECQRPSRSNINVSTWPPASKRLAFYYCDQLSFTATILPSESMLPVWQKLVFIKMSHNICTYYVFKHLARNTCQGHWATVTW